MTDARLPGEWLYAEPWVSLPNDARALAGSLLMWCAQQETDGRISDVTLRTLPGWTQAGADALTDRGVIYSNSDGWRWANWPASQTTRDELIATREGNRKRKADQRARERAELDQLRAQLSQQESRRDTRHE